MQERYGIDLDATNVLDARSARWLRVRILGLLSVESRLRFVMFPPEKPGGDSP